MDKLIAMLLDSFKTKNPKVWAVLALALTAIQYLAQQGTDLGVFQLEGTVAEVVKWVTWLVGLLMGSRTFVALNGDKISEQQTDLDDLKNKYDSLSSENKLIEADRRELLRRLNASATQKKK